MDLKHYLLLGAVQRALESVKKEQIMREYGQGWESFSKEKFCLLADYMAQTIMGQIFPLGFVQLEEKRVVVFGMEKPEEMFYEQIPQSFTSEELISSVLLKRFPQKSGEVAEMSVRPIIAIRQMGDHSLGMALVGEEMRFPDIV